MAPRSQLELNSKGLSSKGLGSKGKPDLWRQWGQRLWQPLAAVVLILVVMGAGVAWGFGGDRSKTEQPLPVPTAPTPAESGTLGQYRLQLATASGILAVDVDAQMGGRITGFSLDGKNVLQGPEIDSQNYGSTLWVSPQAVWDWPPPAAIDRAPYQVTLTPTPSNISPSSTLTLTSPPSPRLGLQIRKTLSLGLAAHQTPALTLTYTLTNTHTEPVRYAPWEVSRVSPTGLTFYGARTKPWGVPAFAVPPTQYQNGMIWWDHDSPGTSPRAASALQSWAQEPKAQAIPADQKLFGDARGGWLAHLDGNLLFLKTFDDTPASQQAPGESEIEVYANGGRTYVEMEVQGAYKLLAPGESRQWTVQWSLHQLPPALVGTKAGDRALADWVRSLIDFSEF